MSLLDDLRLDIGDDAGVTYPSGAPIPIIPDDVWTNPDAFNLLVDLRLDIGDDAGVNYAALSGISTVQGPVIYNSVTVSTSTYTVLLSDVIVWVNAVPAIINLPSSPVISQIFYIKDITGAASALNSIVINPGLNTIEGFSSYSLTTNGGSITIAWNGSEWSII